jgi:hypothetical protein
LKAVELASATTFAASSGSALIRRVAWSMWQSGSPSARCSLSATSALVGKLTRMLQLGGDLLRMS